MRGWWGWGANLLVHQLTEPRVAVAERVHGDAGGEVDVASVFEVPEVAAGAFGEDWHWPYVGCYHVLLVVCDQT